MRPRRDRAVRCRSEPALPYPVDAEEPQGPAVLRNDHDRHVPDPDHLHFPNLSIQVPIDMPVAKVLQPATPVIDQHIPVIGVVPPALDIGIMKVAGADHVRKAIAIQIPDQERPDRGKLAGNRQRDFVEAVGPVVENSRAQFIYGIATGPVEQAPVDDIVKPGFAKRAVSFESLVKARQLGTQLILRREEAFTAIPIDLRDDLLDLAVAVEIVHVHAQGRSIRGFELRVQSQVPRQDIRPAVVVQVGQRESVPEP
jgi:hypothetical protein